MLCDSAVTLAALSDGDDGGDLGAAGDQLCAGAGRLAGRAPVPGDGRYAGSLSKAVYTR